MEGLRQFLRELSKRPRWRVLASYVVGAGIAYEVVVNLTVGLQLPRWFPPLALLLFIVGLPVVISVALLFEKAAAESASDLIIPSQSGAREPRRTREKRRRSRSFRPAITWRNAILGLGSALAIWGVVAGAWVLLEGPPVRRTDRIKVAVLPFENLGLPEDDYFADGLTEEIISRLATIRRLGVISRTSALQYKSTEKSATEIGAELGVDYILEGSVRWEISPDGSARVRVTPQLVRVSDETQVWSQNYDAILAGIFQIQSDIAETVLRAVHIGLVEEEVSVTSTPPTHDLQAYQCYLKGNEYFYRGYEAGDLNIAADYYRRALELDPSFATAHARLSLVHSQVYWFRYDETQARLAQAKRHADVSIELAPQLPESLLAQGYYYYYGRRDYEEALRYFEAARQLQPSNSDLLAAIAYIQRRVNSFDAAVQNLRIAFDLDPRSAIKAFELAETLYYTRDYPAALTYFDRAIDLSPEWYEPYTEKAWLYLSWRGDTRSARRVVDAARFRVELTSLLDTYYWLDLFEGNYESALDCVSWIAFDSVTYYMYTAIAHALAERASESQVYYDSVRVTLERRVGLHVEEGEHGPRLVAEHSRLGVAYAGLGVKPEAIEHGQRALDLLPLSVDAYSGPEWVENMAAIYVSVGEYDAAIELLERLLDSPGWLSSSLLRIDPTWRPLSEHPRFKALIGRHAKDGTDNA